MIAAATPAKLHNGARGARVDSTDVRLGDTVRVTSASGKTWCETVSRIVWTGDDATLCATQRLVLTQHLRPSL